MFSTNMYVLSLTSSGKQAVEVEILLKKRGSSLIDTLSKKKKKIKTKKTQIQSTNSHSHQSHEEEKPTGIWLGFLILLLVSYGVAQK